jgi:hypothetical protein
MSSEKIDDTIPPAETHAQATELFRRPFAPGAIGFRAMTKVTYNGDPYLGAQSVIQRLNAVVPGRWRQEFRHVEVSATAGKKLYLACRLIITLPVLEGALDTEAVYEDIGDMDAGSFAGLKALYSDARKRAGVAAGIGAYLYTALESVVLPIGPGNRQVQAIRRQGKSDLLILSSATEQWLRNGYAIRMSTEAVRRDLGEILPHGEPESGMGQGEAAEQSVQGESGESANATAASPAVPSAPAAPGENGKREGVVAVDFGGLGPAAA